MRRRCSWLLLTAALSTAASSASAEMRVQLSGRVDAGGGGEFSIEVTGSGDYRLGSAQPRVWLVPVSTEPCAVPGPLTERIEVGGRLLLLLHDDRTISAVNPDRSLASSNIAWIAQTGGEVRSWRIDPRGRLMVALRDKPGELAFGLQDGHRIADSASLRPAAAFLDQPPGGDAIRSEWAGIDFRLTDQGRGISLIDIGGDARHDPIALPVAVDRLVLSPDGRWLFGIQGGDGFVMVVDVARRRLTRVLQIHGGIGATAFSDNYLYFRESRSPFVSMLRMSSLANEQEHMFRIPIGMTPSTDSVARLGGDGMVFLHASERVAYLYMESGMADNHGTMRSPTEMLAPYAAVKLRGAKPIDMLVYDMGLRSAGAGRFTGSFRAPHGGRWRLVARDSDSNQTGCLDFSVAGAEPAPPAPGLWLQQIAGSFDAIQLVDVKGRLVGNGPDRIALLALVPGSNWQAAVTAERQNGARYRIAEGLPLAGIVTLVPLTPGPIQGRADVDRKGR